MSSFVAERHLKQVNDFKRPERARGLGFPQADSVCHLDPGHSRGRKDFEQVLLSCAFLGIPVRV